MSILLNGRPPWDRRSLSAARRHRTPSALTRAVTPDPRSPAQRETVFAAWRASVPELAESTGRIEALWRQWPPGATALTLMERDDPRPTALLKRGDWLQQRREVTPGVPAVLHPLPADAGTDRLAFARWLVSPDSPTTARTKVNRVWQHLFGTGFVASSEDLGVQSEPPSHPEKKSATRPTPHRHLTARPRHRHPHRPRPPQYRRGDYQGITRELRSELRFSALYSRHMKPHPRPPHHGPHFTANNRKR